jgi:outer membrane protein
MAVFGVFWMLAACAGATNTQSGAAPPPVAQIGVVDFQRVFNETDAGKKARESLNTFMKNRQDLIQLEQKDLQRMEEDLRKQASVLSANARKDREEQFQRRMMEYQQKVNELNREVQEKQKEVLDAFRERVEKVVGRVAQKLRMVVVMEKGRGSPTLYSDSTLDITDKVVEEFNKGTL